MARILLVDDDDSFRPMVQMLLERLGHEVTIATNGRTAVTHYADRRSDVVLTDIVMPDQEGLETIRELRRRDPGARIIAMSGGGRLQPEGYLHLALRFGAICALSKPFSREQLTDALETAMASESGAPATP